MDKISCIWTVVDDSYVYFYDARKYPTYEASKNNSPYAELSRVEVKYY